MAQTPRLHLELKRIHLEILAIEKQRLCVQSHSHLFLNKE